MSSYNYNPDKEDDRGSSIPRHRCRPADDNGWQCRTYVGDKEDKNWDDVNEYDGIVVNDGREVVMHNVQRAFFDKEGCDEKEVDGSSMLVCGEIEEN